MKIFYHILNAISYYYYYLCYNEIIHTHDISNIIGGSWIKSAKNSEYDYQNNVLCADLRTREHTKRYEGNPRKYYFSEKYKYKRDCVIINPNCKKHLENNDGRFEEYKNITCSPEYYNEITRVTGLEMYTIEYFPGALCIGDIYREKYCPYHNCDLVLREYCTDYANDTKHIIFDTSTFKFKIFKSYNDYLKSIHRTI